MIDRSRADGTPLARARGALHVENHARRGVQRLHDDGRQGAHRATEQGEEVEGRVGQDARRGHYGLQTRQLKGGASPAARPRARALAAGWPRAHVWFVLCRVPASSSSRTRCPTYATCSRRRCPCSGHRRRRRDPRTQQPSDLTSGAGYGPRLRPRSPQALSDLRSQLVQALEDVESEIEVALPPPPRTPSSRHPASKAAVRVTRVLVAGHWRLGDSREQQVGRRRERGVGTDECEPRS